MSDNGLVKRLLELQGLEGYTQGEMARLLGISDAYWSRIVRGKRGVGRKVLVGVVKNLPALSAEALRELRRM